MWKLFFGKSKEDYFQEVMDQLSGMDGNYSNLTTGVEDVKELLEDSRKSGDLQEEKLERILTIMEDWMNTYEEKLVRLGEEKEKELQSGTERENNFYLEEKKEREYLQQIEKLQNQAGEYKQKLEESETNVWSLQKDINSLKKQIGSMQNNQLNSLSKKKSALSGRQARGRSPELSQEEQSFIKEQYDCFPISKDSRTTIFNPMRYSK
jgi:DNA repair ATPase RecN